MAHSVLIVDDDSELRGIYRTILEREGYTLYEVANGAEALQFLINHIPDVIIMDMLMPMLGGEVVLQRLRQMPALHKTRIIVLTAYPRFRDTAGLLQADLFLVKPIRPSDLIEGLHTVLQQESDQKEV